MDSKESRESANPYLNAKRVWDERYGDSLTRARNWRLVAIGCIGVTALAVCGIAYIGSQSKIQPMVVTLDKLGSPIALAKPSTGNVEQRILTSQIANWLWNARTVLPDGSAQKELINRTYAMASTQTAQFLSSEYAANPPFGGKTVNVNITGVLPISQDTYQVTWDETTTLDGQPRPVQHWKANITTGIDPRLASKPEVILANPLGIYVKNLSWTQLLSGK